MSDHVWQSIGHDLSLTQLNDDEYLVFNGHSSDSSLLNVVDATLLSQFLQPSLPRLTEPELFLQTATVLDLPCDDALRKYVRASLEQMAFVGLIYRSAVP